MAGYIGSKASVVTPGAEYKKVFDITATTTSLTGLTYTPNFVHVFHNGVRLVDGTDYTATNGTSITLTNAALSGDEVVVISYGTYQNVDSYTKGEADSRYVNVTGDTMTGSLTANGGVYLGGTGASNKLDDYEEGTWSPYWSNASGNAIFNAAPADPSGRYTKVGDTVHAQCYFSMPPSFGATGSYVASGHLCVGGLPFTSNRSGSLDYAGVSVGWYNSFGGWGAGYSPMMYVESGTTVMPLVYAGGTVITIVQQVVAYNAGSGLIISVSYKTAS